MTVRPSSWLAAALLIAVTTPAASQPFPNPFAARPVGTPGAGLGPYGNDTGAALHLMQTAQSTIPLPAAAARSAAAARLAPAGDEAEEMPHRAELREGSRVLEAMFVGCSAGAFLGGYTAWSSATPVIAAELAVAGPAGAGIATALGAAAAIGCGLGAATGAISVTASALWSWAVR